eukprot:SAG31_NODE_4910_length_2872_cov_2.604039_4_plen_33_part_00
MTYWGNAASVMAMFPTIPTLTTLLTAPMALVQ